MGTIHQLFQESMGVGAGISLGMLFGLGLRKRSGKTEGLIGGSVIVTAAVFGMVATAVMMLLKFIWG